MKNQNSQVIVIIFPSCTHIKTPHLSVYLIPLLTPANLTEYLLTPLNTYYLQITANPC